MYFLYNNFMNPEQFLGLEYFDQRKDQILCLVEENEGSVQKLIRSAAQTHQSIEQECLEGMVNECNVKQRTISIVSSYACKNQTNVVQLYEKLKNVIQFDQISNIKVLQKQQELEELKKYNNLLKQTNFEKQKQMKDLRDKMIEIQHNFEYEKNNIREQLHQEYEDYMKEILKNEKNKHQNLLVQIRELQEKLEKYMKDNEEKENRMIELKKNVEEIERDCGIKDYHFGKLEESYLIVVEQNKRLSEDNRILCDQVKELWSLKNSSTVEPSQSQKSNSLFSSIYVENDQFNNDAKVQEKLSNKSEGKQSQISMQRQTQRGENMFYRVESLQRLSSVASIESLGEANMQSLSSFRNFHQMVSVGVMTDFSPISPFKKQSNEQFLGDSVIIDRIDSNQLKQRMGKKERKQDVICIGEDQGLKMNQSFMTSLVYKRTHKTRPSQSILEIEQKKKKNNLSFIQNNTFTQKIVTSRIKNKVNKSLNQTSTKNTNFINNISKLLVTGRIKK